MTSSVHILLYIIHTREREREERERERERERRERGERESERTDHKTFRTLFTPIVLADSL